MRYKKYNSGDSRPSGKNQICGKMRQKKLGILTNAYNFSYNIMYAYYCGNRK